MINSFARLAHVAGVVAILTGVAVLALGQPPKPAEIPTANEIKIAVETLQDVYDKDYAAAEKDSKAKKALARKLFDAAPKRKTAAMIFACYDESRRLAAEGGDAKLAVAAVNVLNQRFPGLPRSLLRDTIKQLTTADVPPADAVPLAHLAREEAALALDREDYEGAVELIGFAAAAAKMAEDLDLAIELRENRTRIESLRNAMKALKAKPDDPEANATLGVYWTFDRGKWDAGLKYLARGSDKTLAEAASKDVAKPKTARERTALADLWYKLGRDAQAERKVMLIERAWEWYSAAIVVAQGDDDFKPTERVREIEKAYPDLFDRIFTGHTAAVAAIAITHDGKTLVSVGNDNSVRLWDAATGKLIKTLDGHTAWVGSVVITPDDAKAITAGGDSAIRIWDLKTGKQTGALEGHSVAIRGLALTADGRFLLSGASDKTCRLWDLTTNKEIKKFGDGKESVESVAISPDGSHVLVGNEVGVVTVYDAKTGSVVSRFDKHSGAMVYVIAVTKDGKTVLSGARDKEIQVWELATGKQLKTLSGHTEQVYQLALSPDEKQVLSASYDKTIRIWDLATGKELKKFEGHADGVQGACYSPDGRSVYSASWDKTIRKWRVPPVLTGSAPPTKKVD